MFNFTLGFNTTGLGNIFAARNALQSLGGTSYTVFNTMVRSMSSAERRFSQFMSTLGTTQGFSMLSRSLVMNNAELQTNMIIFTSLMKGNKQKAEEMIAMLRDNAAELGYAESEVFKAARGLYSGFSSGGRNVTVENMKDLMEMTELLNALDTQNLGLSYTAFAIKEVSQGVGMSDFRSLINRLEVQMTKARKEAITKALQNKDVNKSISELYQGLLEAGIDRSMLDKIMTGSLMANVNAIRGYVTRMMSGIGLPLVNEITKSLVNVKEAMKTQMKPDSDLMIAFDIIGKQLSQRVGGAFDVALLAAGDFLSRTDLTPFFAEVEKSAKLARSSIKALSESFAEIKRTIPYIYKDVTEAFTTTFPGLNKPLTSTDITGPIRQMISGTATLFRDLADTFVLFMSGISRGLGGTEITSFSQALDAMFGLITKIIRSNLFQTLVYIGGYMTGFLASLLKSPEAFGALLLGLAAFGVSLPQAILAALNPFTIFSLLFSGLSTAYEFALARSLAPAAAGAAGAAAAAGGQTFIGRLFAGLFGANTRSPIMQWFRGTASFAAITAFLTGIRTAFMGGITFLGTAIWGGITTMFGTLLVWGLQLATWVTTGITALGGLGPILIGVLAVTLISVLIYALYNTDWKRVGEAFTNIIQQIYEYAVGYKPFVETDRKKTLMEALNQSPSQTNIVNKGVSRTPTNAPGFMQRSYLTPDEYSYTPLNTPTKAINQQTKVVNQKPTINQNVTVNVQNATSSDSIVSAITSNINRLMGDVSLLFDNPNPYTA